MHHRIDILWSLEYRLIVSEDSILLYSLGKTEEARDLWVKADLKENLARQIDELPMVFGETLSGYPVISGNEVKGIFRHFIASSLTAKNHKVCVPSTKRHMKEIVRKGKSPIREYYIPFERVAECPPEKPCFVCKWFGTASYESPLYFSFLICNKPFRDVMSAVVPMIAFDEQFGGAAGGALVGIVGIKGGTEFKGEISGLNLDPVILGGLYDVVKASEKGFIKFGRHRTRGFGRAKLEFIRIIKYSVAPFKEERRWEGEELKSYLEECWAKYSEFAENPSEPEEIKMKLVEKKGE